MDQGVIQNFKVHYRKHILKSIIANMEHSRSADELAKTISVLDAVRWIGSAVNAVTPTCVAKCFWKCGIKNNIEATLQTEADEEGISGLRSLIADGTDPRDYVNIDYHVSTEAGFQNLDEIIATRLNGAESDDGDEETEDESVGISESKKNSKHF